MRDDHQLAPWLREIDDARQELREWRLAASPRTSSFMLGNWWGAYHPIQPSVPIDRVGRFTDPSLRTLDPDWLAQYGYPLGTDVYLPPRRMPWNSGAASLALY